MDMTSTTRTDARNHAAEAALQQAADDQGLTPAVEALTASEITHYVAHTGGGCMVIEIPLDVYYLADGTPSYEGYVGVTSDEITGEGFCVVLYSDAAANGEAEPEILTESVDLAGMVALVVETFDGLCPGWTATPV